MTTFNEIVDPHGQNTDEDSYKALTALGLLNAIQTLVKASFNEHEVCVCVCVCACVCVCVCMCVCLFGGIYVCTLGWVMAVHLTLT